MPDHISTRHLTYRDYTADVSPRLAVWILAVFVAALLAAEAAARVFPPRYERTAICSLHGLRTLFQEAADDPEPKIVAVGDSTLVGGGVYDDHLTVMGRMETALNQGPKIYNLALPGGDTSTSLVVLNALQRAHVRQVQRVLIEVLPGKFIVDAPATATPRDSSRLVMDEIDRLIPFARPAAYDLPHRDRPYTDRVETALEFGLGHVSALYHNRDYFRTQYLGNYPSFWLLAHILPQRLKSRIFPAKAQGTNRLAARMDDYPFDPNTAQTIPKQTPRFTPRGEGDYLQEAITVSRAISGKPPLIVVFPVHYDYNRLTPAQRAAYIRELGSFNTYILQIGLQTGSDVVAVNSPNFQNPHLWTATAAHFNAQGSAAVWNDIKPEICHFFGCVP